MFSADGILGRNFGILSAGMDGLALRQSVHAQNIANIDTDGYQARTVDFENVLRSAIKDGTGPMNASGAFMPASTTDAVTGGELSSRFAVVSRPGGLGKGISRTQEVSAMMNDNIRFRIISQQVQNRISELRSVISEMGRS